MFSSSLPPPAPVHRPLAGFFAGILAITFTLNAQVGYSTLRTGGGGTQGTRANRQTLDAPPPQAQQERAAGVDAPPPLILHRRGPVSAPARAGPAPLSPPTGPLGESGSSIPGAPWAGTGGVCSGVSIAPPDGVDAHAYVVVSAADVDAKLYPCFQTTLAHWELEHYHKQPPLPFCTHDPAVDEVISGALHKYHFWSSPNDFRVLIATGPCTPSRPYMLDIGANIGLFTLVGAYHGCAVLAFEPLAENNHRLLQTLVLNGLQSKARVYKHAVGRKYERVTLGFRATNPGSSGINLGGTSTETVEQITIDALLAGPERHAFAAQGLPSLNGSTINMVKIDTEGWDVAVFAGAVDTILRGRVPHVLVEFSPGDAHGTAMCDPTAFLRVLYDAGYTMYEHGRAYSRDAALTWVVPHGLSGKGKRVWEVWFLLEAPAEALVASDLLKDRPGAGGNPGLPKEGRRAR